MHNLCKVYLEFVWMSLVLQNKLCKSISVTRKSDTLKAVHKLDVNIALRFDFAIGMFSSLFLLDFVYEFLVNYT